MARVTSRDYLNLYSRQGADQLPGARISDDIQQVQIVDDFSHLSRPIPNVHWETFQALAAQGAGTFVAWRITAPPNRIVKINRIENRDAARSGIVAMSIDAGDVFVFIEAAPVLATGGPDNIVVPGDGGGRLAVVSIGLVDGIQTGVVDRLIFGPDQVSEAQPIFVLPGQSLFASCVDANVAWSLQISAEELPA